MVERARASPTTGFQLRSVLEGDLPIFFEHQRDPEANQMAGFPARDRDAFMAHWAKILSDDTVTAMSIVLDGNVAGNIVSWEHDGKRLIGYWLGKENWGKGVATTALTEYLRLVTTRPLFAEVAKHNVASIRVLEKCGFKMCIEGAAPDGAPGNSVGELVLKLSAVS